MNKFLFFSVLSVLVSPVQCRDTHNYAQSNPELHQWFESLRSGKGPCCSDADGTAVADADWEGTGDPENPFKVRIDGEWWPVSKDAVITESNKYGRTVVWPIRYWDGAKLTISVRCFIMGPGI